MCNPQDDIGYVRDFIEDLENILNKINDKNESLDIFYDIKDAIYYLQRLKDFCNNHMIHTGK